MLHFCAPAAVDGETQRPEIMTVVRTMSPGNMPVAQRHLAPIGVQRQPGAQQRVLKGLVRVVQETQHPVGVHVQGAQVRADQNLECHWAPMKGMIFVDSEGVDGDALRQWVDAAVGYVRDLPPEQAAPACKRQ
jgi:hypothetical protein